MGRTSKGTAFGARQQESEDHKMENENKIPAGAAQQIETEQPDAGYPVTTMHGTPRTRHRSPEEYQDLINRLNRVEGQVRGIRGMVERDAYCPDILVQVAAANAALNAFNKELLANHIRTCVAQDIRDGKDETIDELVATLQKLMK